MNALKIESIPFGGVGIVTQRISGFQDGELERLKSMKHEEARGELLKMLDLRNNNTGTCWQCGYGVYGLWFDNEYAYVNIGSSCD